jgi:hypothetical protein
LGLARSDGFRSDQDLCPNRGEATVFRRLLYKGNALVELCIALMRSTRSVQVCSDGVTTVMQIGKLCLLQREHEVCCAGR